MITVKNAYNLCRKINSKTVDGENVVYYKVGTDTACTTTIGDTDYHFIDGTSNLIEGIKNFFAWGRKKRHYAFISYSRPADRIFRLEEFKKRVDYTKRNVIFGISRGGAVASFFTANFIEECIRLGIKPNLITIPVVAPPAGGKRFQAYCEELAFECLRYEMEGGIVPSLPLYGKKYQTELIILPNKIKSKIRKHLLVGEYLPDRMI